MNFYLNKLFILIAFCLLMSCGSEPALTPLQPNDAILAFGDSITYGTGATPETSYPSDLQKIVGNKVINAGIPGEETRDSLLRITNTLNQTNPKLVIVCLGGNDLLRNRPIADIKDNLRKIIQIIQSHGAQVVLIGVPQISYDLSVPDYYEELGEEFSIPVDVKTYRELIKDPQYKADYIHLNAAGYQVMAERIAALLKSSWAK